MDQLNVTEIANYWAAKIVKDVPAIKLEMLDDVEMPSALRNNLKSQGKSKIEKEIIHILDSPFLDLSPKASNGASLRETLYQLLSQRMVLPKESIIEMVTEVYAQLLDEWAVEPLSIRQASTDPAGLAESVFVRASAIAAPQNGTERYSNGVIAQICNVSGLGTLALTVQLEASLGADNVNIDEFCNIIQRLIMLKEHYQVGHNLVSFVGTSEFLTADIDKPIQKIESAPPETVTPISEERKPSSTPIPKVELADPTPESGTSTLELPDLSQINPFLSPELTTTFKKGAENSNIDLGIHSDITPPEPVSTPTDLDEKGLFIFAILMHPIKRAYLGNKLFDDNFGAYDQMVVRICHQKSMQHAIVIADNELYIHGISVDQIPAAELIRTIKTYFGKTKFNE